MPLHPMHPVLAALPLMALALSAAPRALSAIPEDRLSTVVPAPSSMVHTGGAFTLDAKTRILTDGSREARAVAPMLTGRLRAATGFPLPIERASDRVPSNSIVLRHAGSPDLGAEGYTLEVTPGGATLAAPRRAGLFYAVQTLRQLLPPQLESPTRVEGVAWRIPGVRIEDAPRFPWRGLLIDSSRHIQSVDFIKRTLDRMAYHKLNTFHWHITDDPGWRMESKKYPKLTEVGAWRTEEDGTRYGGFYTQEQIRDIVRYAAERNITVVPEIEMPGHSAGAIAAYPFLACKPGNYHVYRVGEGIASICPGKETTYVFYRDILTEVMDLFPSKIIHIGGDEVDKANWRVCPDCQALIRREGLADEKALQHYFIRRMAEFLQKTGRRLQGWNEIMEGGPLPKGVVMQQWNDPESGAKAARAGNDVVVSPTTWGYFDYTYETIPLRKVYDADPVPAGLTPEQRKRILGPQANLWTEWRPTDASVDDFTWPRLIALAEMGWSQPANRNWDDFVRRMQDAHYDRLALMGLSDPGLVGQDLKAKLLEHSGFDAGK